MWSVGLIWTIVISYRQHSMLYTVVFLTVAWWINEIECLQLYLTPKKSMNFDCKINLNLPSQNVLDSAPWSVCFRMRIVLFTVFCSYSFTKVYEGKQCLLRNDQWVWTILFPANPLQDVKYLAVHFMKIQRNV